MRMHTIKYNMKKRWGGIHSLAKLGAGTSKLNYDFCSMTKLSQNLCEMWSKLCTCDRYLHHPHIQLLCGICVSLAHRVYSSIFRTELGFKLLRIEV